MHLLIIDKLKIPSNPLACLDGFGCAFTFSVCNVGEREKGGMEEIRHWQEYHVWV